MNRVELLELALDRGIEIDIDRATEMTETEIQGLIIQSYKREEEQRKEENIQAERQLEEKAREKKFFDILEGRRN